MSANTMKIIPLILLTAAMMLSGLQAEDMHRYRQETVRLTKEGQNQEYELINRYLTDVEQEYRNSYADYLRDLNMFQESNHRKWVRSDFEKETEQLAKLAEFNSEDTFAKEIRSRAAAVLESKDGIID